MQANTVKSLLKHRNAWQITGIRSKTSSGQYVASRARDATFEKLMDKYKNLLKVIAIQDLILANPTNNPPSVSLDFLSKLSQKLHLNHGAASFLRKYPHIFHIFYDPVKSQPFCRLNDAAMDSACQEAASISASVPVVVDRLVRLFSMSTTKSMPLRAVFKVWKKLGLPDDFEHSVIAGNPHIFRLADAYEPNTHILELVDEMRDRSYVASVEKWRVLECCKDDFGVNTTDIRNGFETWVPANDEVEPGF